MKIIVPMAGLGTRFQKVSDTNPEYRKPKPLISVKGVPMVRWATGSLKFLEHPGQKVEAVQPATPKDLIFVILEEHDRNYNLENKLKEIYLPDIRVIKLEKPTRGAAETAYAAKEFVDPDEDAIISDSDHYFDGSNLTERIANKGKDVAGIIPVFTPPNDGLPRWSYSLLKSGSAVIEKVGEKDPELMKLGAPANIGAYYFSKAKTFFDEVAEVILRNEMTGEEGKKEFYVAPIYQRLIEKGLKFEAALIPEVWGLGTPSDLEFFLMNCGTEKP